MTEYGHICSILLFFYGFKFPDNKNTSKGDIFHDQNIDFLTVFMLCILEFTSKYMNNDYGYEDRIA